MTMSCQKISSDTLIHIGLISGITLYIDMNSSNYEFDSNFQQTK